MSATPVVRAIDCDYTNIRVASEEYQTSVEAEEAACDTLSTAEAALAEAQTVYDNTNAALQDAINNTNAAKVALDEAHDAKRT